MKKRLKDLRNAADILANTSEIEKRLFYYYLAVALRKNMKKIERANAIDLRKAVRAGLSAAFVSRMKMGKTEIDQTLKRIDAVSKSDQVIGTVLIQKKLENGMKLQKIRVPLGVVCVIYEARPEVTIDVICICVKSSNGVILKSGTEIKNTNKILFSCVASALRKSKLPQKCIYSLEIKSRKILYKILSLDNAADLVIARGGYAMVKEVMKKSHIPVLAHSSGGARIFVDKSADQNKAIDIVVNSKISKPAACNSVDTILIHRKIGKTFIPVLTKSLAEKKVKIIKSNKWDKEQLGLTVGIKMVKDVKEAVGFIKKYTKGHTEAIVAQDKKIIEYFTKEVDSASLMVNCSTRLHDGGVYGFGAEMGIATGKLHARGPVGTTDLTTCKWIVSGNGQIRE